MKFGPRHWIYIPPIFLGLYALVLGYNLIAVRGVFAPRHPLSEAPATAVAAGTSGHRIVGRLFVTGPPDPSHPLIVLLHGDAPFVNPAYQYSVAKAIANDIPGTRVIALLRPGYSDPYGEKSEGNRGFSSGENYTPTVIDDLANAIATLKEQYAAPSLILAGHSGGATLTADIAALHPGLVQQAILVSCPCDVPAFRHHMWQFQHAPLWLFPTHSISPLDALVHADKNLAITAISGADDPLALPPYADAYVKKANSQGITATMVLLPQKQHEIFTERAVIDAIAQAATPNGSAR